MNFGYPNREERNKYFYGNNYLLMNKGKTLTFYVSFPNSKEWKDIIFKGVLENSDEKYSLIRDINSNKLILIFNDYIDYIVFE